jgi:hypothetical protein
MFRMTVPVDVVPPVTEFGFKLTDDNETGGFTVSVALCVTL